MKYNSTYTTNFQEISRKTTEEIALLARDFLPARREKNTYECPVCNGKLYVAKNNQKITCVTGNCKGIFKAILQVSGEWDKQRELYKEEREREYQAKRDSQKVLPDVSRQINLTPGKGLTETHYKEFADSGISREIADLNYVGLSNNSIITKVLGWSKYDHTPGFYCGGIDLNTGDHRKELKGQFKPDKPLLLKGETKPAKYFTTKYGYDAIAPIHPAVDWDKVKNDISIPVLITEGTKKAISYMEATGLPAISVPGVEMFQVGDDFVPNLKALVGKGRGFNIAYDADKNCKSGVASALKRLANKLIDAKCSVNITEWGDEYKGIDDYLVNIPASDRHIKFIPFEEWIEKETKKTEIPYQGEVLVITDKDLPQPCLKIPSFFNRENSDNLIKKVEAYRQSGCKSFRQLPLDKLKELAKANNVRLTLTRLEAIEKIIRLVEAGDDLREMLSGFNSEQLKAFAKTAGVRNLFGITSYELAERLEKAGVSKDGIDFTDDLVLTIKIDHPAGGFIASTLESANRLDDPKYNINLPFDLIKEGQYLNHKKAVRNNPKAMEHSATFANWKNSRKFTADHITNVPFLNQSDLLRNIDLADGQIHAILSGLGTGKTTLMIELAKVVKEKHPDYNIMIVSYRNGLVFNTVAKMKTSGLPMRESKEFKDNVGYIKKDDTAWVGFCCDSLLDIDQRMYKGWEKNTIFIADECDSVINHALFSTTMKERRIPIIKRLLECLRASAGILALSGTLNNTCLKFFNGIGKNIIKYQNITDRPKIPVRWILGSSEDVETDILQIKEKDNFKVVDNLSARLKNNEKCIVSSDSQKECERLHIYYENLFEGKKKIIRIDRKTRSKSESSPFIDSILRSPEKIAELGCDLLIYNSSAESGVDISFDQEKYPNYFSHQFHFGYGIVSIDSNIQLLRRYRGGCPLTVWMTPTINNRPALLQGNDLEFDRKIRMIEAGFTKESQPDDYVCELADELAFNLAYEKSNIRQCMLQALTEHGYEIEYICNDETDTNLAEESKLIEEEYATEVFNADPKFIDDFSDKKEDEQSWENQLASTKAYYFREFGYTKEDHENKDHELFTIANIIEIEKYNGRFFGKAKNHIYINLSKDDLKMLQRKKYSGEFPIFYRDVKQLISPLTAINKSGLAELINKDEISLDDNIFNQIRGYASKHPRQWLALCGGVYSDKFFFKQVRTILDTFFGVEFKKDKTKASIKRDDLMMLTVNQIKEKIKEKLENDKNQAAQESGQQVRSDLINRAEETKTKIFALLSGIKLSEVDELKAKIAEKIDDIKYRIIKEAEDVTPEGLEEFKARITGNIERYEAKLINSIKDKLNL